MSPIRRVLLCGLLLSVGLAAEAALDRATRIERPPLKGPLASVPLALGDWVGEDIEPDPDVLRESQADDYLNRAYESRTRGGAKFRVWVNYSRRGDNLRHSPEVCLPSGGWAKVEAECRSLSVDTGAGKPLPVSRLVYSKDALVQAIGFWYYIFGEGRLEHWVRGLPITSRSSHGRTTRGSGLTVEIFFPAESDPDDDALKELARDLLGELDKLLPDNRAEYHVP
jgi:EpsI family protein